jgi:hypothetical protein
MGLTIRLKQLVGLFLGFAALFVAAGPSAISARGATSTPLLYPLVPSATAPGGPAFTMTVTGTGFVSGAVVNWNGSPRTTTFVNGSQLQAAITAVDIANQGTAAITVKNPTPGGGTSNPQFFHVTNPTVGLAFHDSPVSAGQFQQKPVVADFNGDGKLDITVSTGGNAVQILLGNGDGTFQAPVSVTAAPSGTLIEDVAVGDFNGDGIADLVVSYLDNNVSNYQYGTSVVLGNGNGTFRAPVTSLVTSGTILTVAATFVADVNGDGVADLVRATASGILVELGNGDGTFRLQFTYTTPVNNSYFSGHDPVNSLTLGDFQKNGKLDIVASVDPYYLVILPGNGDGTFGAASLMNTVDAASIDSVVAADFNGDGNLDVAVYYDSAHPPQPQDIATSGVLSMLLGNGDGTFQSPLTLAGLPESIETRAALLPGDFNGDGHLDLAVSSAVVLIGNGGTFLSHSVIPTPQQAFVAGDFNGDGRLDLAGMDPAGPLVHVLHVLLQTAPPVDFQGSINPQYQNLVAGGSANYTITVTAIDGFTGTVQFSASGLPAGATATFNPTTIIGSGTTTVTITTASNTPTASYPIQLSGTSGTITHSGTVNLNVGPAGTDFTDFGGSISPGYQTVAPGGGTTFNLSLFPIKGFNSNVNLSLGGLPTGATATFNPSVIPGGSGSSVLTISTVSPTSTGTYQLTITATGAGHTHTNGVNLNVGPAGTDFTDFTGTVTPAMQTVSVGGTTTFTAMVQPFDGSGCVYLQVYGLPSATHAYFDRSTPICGAPASTVFTITTYPQTPTGTYTLTFSGKSSGGSVHSKIVTLNVTP